MICPVCGNTLRAIERSGIEIDICPGCKGIWLDRGELDKIIQREASSMEQGYEAPPQRAYPREQEHHDRHYDHDHEHDQRYRSHEHDERYREGQYPQKRNRRGSWITDLFEGFGGDD
ncbi:MAG TPA: zf-TFIIB domain-containing protein [Armatimonadota bacterium]|nr:zf-TFIIB domain-containing protein [Armatimonadota bacterium]